MMETPRLTIRRFAPGDWRDLYEYLSDPNVVKYEPYDAFTKEKCVFEAGLRAKNDAYWAVCLKGNGKCIGNLYIKKQDFDTWELGYVFNAAYQGQGYATESAKALMTYAFDTLKARRMIAKCNPDNVKSWRLLERLGMRREGHLRQTGYFKTDGSGCPIWHDTYEYGLLAGEWEGACIQT